MNPLTFIVFAAPNPGAVAHQALLDAAALTRKVEAGGSIYQCGSTFAYTAPITGKKAHVDIPIATFPDGTCRVVATYHTHPRGDSRFSRQDIETTCKVGVPSYILPLDGKVRVFDCSGLSDVARRLAPNDPVLSRGVISVTLSNQQIGESK